ncbi:MAG: hypothetical protein ACLS6G_00870 [Christensenellales bacterium]
MSVAIASMKAAKAGPAHYGGTSTRTYTSTARRGKARTGGRRTGE